MTPRKRMAMLLAGFAVCAGLVIADRQSPAADDEVVQPVTRSAAMPAPRTVPASDEGGILALAPRTDYGKAGDGFFAPVRPPAPPPPPPAPPPPPPSAPPPPFAVIGKQLVDGKWEVFLAFGEASLIAHANERLDANWQVVAIRPPVMELEYLPLNQRTTLAIGANFDD